MPHQSSSHILLVRPVGFHSNPETRLTNGHQHRDDAPCHTIQEHAKQEHLTFQEMLEQHHIQVTVFEGQSQCPDDVFCNNWVSTFSEGTYQLYPLRAHNRRSERRADILSFLNQHYGLDCDLTSYEESDQFLESTGSMVLDRVNRIAYAARSPRTDESLFHEWCQKQNYKPILFDAYDQHNKPEYHTNVMMFIGTEIAVICAEHIHADQRVAVLDQLSRTHHVIHITYPQVQRFCGNILEVCSIDRSQRFLAMSTTAYTGFTEEQREKFNLHYDAILHTDIETIEKYGGGSARCMMLELF